MTGLSLASSISNFTTDNRLWIASELNGIAILNLKQSMFLSPEEISLEYIQEGEIGRASCRERV